MTWLDAQRNRHNIDGGNIKNAHEKFTSEYIMQAMKDSPTYKEVLINGELYNTRMVTEKKYSVASGYSVMKLMYEPFVKPRNGQLAYIDDEIWLTVHASDKELAPINYIRKCTHTITVKLDNKEHIVPCVVETRVRDTQKIFEMVYVDLSLDSLKITVPYNDITKTIVEKDRFVIEGIAWEVQGFDRITHVDKGDGIIEIASKKVPLSNEEKKALEDAKNKIDDTIVVLTIEGKDKIPRKGKAQYKGVVTYDGKIIEGGATRWSSEAGVIDADGLFTATCDVGEFIIEASYDYIDGCCKEKTVKAQKKVTVFNNKDWW